MEARIAAAERRARSSLGGQAELQAHHELGELLEAAGEYDRARVVYERACASANQQLAEPGSAVGEEEVARCFNNLALAAKRSGDLQAAEKAYERALRHAPPNSSSRSLIEENIQRMQRRWNRPAVSRDELKTSIRPSNADEADQLRLKGNEAFKRGHLDVAFWRYTAALAADPTAAAQVLGNRSFVYCRLGDGASAEGDAREALRLQPGYAKGALRLGRALELQGRFTEAAEAFETAANLERANSASGVAEQMSAAAAEMRSRARDDA
mmetsp:Transcript_15412/g.50653  ORF Transcript_15412/g.50653 Transcript_15412/m.50653 type:complete len:269 (+) Transcript_15412:39-845(+)